MNKRVPFLAALTIAGAVTLTGCGGASQSVEEACGIVNTTMSELESQFADVGTEAAAGDFSQVSEVYNALVEKFDEANGKISNEEVKSVVDDMREAIADGAELFSGLDSGDLTALMDEENQQKLTTMGEDLAAASTDYQEVCGASS